MPKKQNESYIEYKERVIDPISDSFCGAKWNNATIWLGSGTTASCHHPPAHRINIDEIKKNPKALHNTKHKKLMRKLMLEGKRPTECEYCWKIEDMNRDKVSDRVFKTVIYSDESIERISKLPWDTDVPLETLEIAFDRTCNFACSYCNASFSTTWAKDIKKDGPYQNLVSDGAAAFQQDGAWAQPFDLEEENPYIQAFWEWWPELSKTLTELRITGGEPLMAQSVWKLFDYFEEHGSGNILFSVNSNLGGKADLINRLIEKSYSVNKFDLYTSCEATGTQAEYIRDGLDWDYWLSNMYKLSEKANLRALHVMMTINSLCLFSITDFMDEMLKLRKHFNNPHLATMSFNILRFPSFMSPLALPNHIKDNRREHLKEWLEKNKHNELLHEMEFDGIDRLIDYLEVVDAPHRRVSGKESQWRDFKSFYKQYDMRRGKSLSVFPTILTDWVASLPDTELNIEQGLVDGDSTKGWHDNEELKQLAKKEGWELNPQGANPGSVDYQDK